MTRAKRRPHPQLHQWFRVLMATFLICVSLALGSIGGVFLQMVGDGQIRTVRIYNPTTGDYQEVTLNQQPLNPLDMLSMSSLDRRINILVLGSDYNYVRGKRVDEKTSGLRSRTDTIMLLSLDPGSGKATLLSIPRDTRALLTGYHYDKINAAMTYGGVDLVKSTVSDLTGVPIDYYMALKVDGLINMVDIIGGIRIYVEKDMKYQDDTAHLGINIHKGWKERMNGEQAHQYVRFRKDELGDIGRVQRQQKFIRAVIDKLLQPASWIKFPALVQHMNENIETDIPSDVIGQIVRFGTGLDKDEIRMVMLPGTFADIGGISFWQMNPYLARNVITDLFPDSSLAETQEPSLVTDSTIPVNPYARYRVTVWNATDDRAVGREVVRRLRESGWNVWSIVKAPHGAPTTRYIAQTGKSELLADLQKSVRFPRGEKLTASIGDIASDFTVLISEDLAVFLHHTMKPEDWNRAEQAPMPTTPSYQTRQRIRPKAQIAPQQPATQLSTPAQPAQAIRQPQEPAAAQFEQPAADPAQGLQQTPAEPVRPQLQREIQPELPASARQVQPATDPATQRDPLYD